MKHLLKLTLLCLTVTTCININAEVKTLAIHNREINQTITSNIVVNANQTFKVLYLDLLNSADFSAKYTYSVNNRTESDSIMLYDTSIPERQYFIRGPTTISISVQTPATRNKNDFVLTYDLSTINENTNINETLPSNTVVIPSDSGGPVQIILESSVDLITWTKADPGTYGTSTQKRFFRIRAVR